MRADAQRNSDRLKQAAATLFSERGLDVPAKEIARKAGVSHGTLYHLFGGREALVDAVIVDLVADCLDHVAAEALAVDDPWEGFASYVMAVCELQVTHPAIADVVTGALPSSPRLMQMCEQTAMAARRIMDRARDAGDLRGDVTTDDLLQLFAASAAISRGGDDSRQWPRHAGFVLDGFRARGHNGGTSERAT